MDWLDLFNSTALLDQDHPSSDLWYEMAIYSFHFHVLI